MPPWGGELAMEILPLLDYKRLKSVKPKWLLGFSDVSTILATIATKIGWSTVHCANLMQLHPDESELLTSRTLEHLKLNSGASFVQHSSHYNIGLVFVGRWISPL